MLTIHIFQPIRNYLKQNSKFLDSLRIHVRGGAGGFGFPKYGGEGGKGGDVRLVATEGEVILIVHLVRLFNVPRSINYQT